MNNTDLMWLVGFYEGEGSCGCYSKTSYYKNKKYVYPKGSLIVTISQKDKEIVDWIQKRLGFGSVRVRPQSSSSIGGSVWIWNACHQNAKKFLKLIRPHLKIQRRKDQLNRALSTFEAK